MYIRVSLHVFAFRRFNNSFTGVLPGESIAKWRDLNVFYVADNFFAGSLPSAIANWFPLTHLELQNNMFSGELPEAAIREWQFLVDFGVWNNDFSGSLPQSVGAWSNLERISL